MLVGRMADTNCSRCSVVNFPVNFIHKVTTGLFALLSAVSVVVCCKLCAAGLSSTVKEEWRIVHAKLSGGKILAGSSIIFTLVCPLFGFCLCELWL